MGKAYDDEYTSYVIHIAACRCHVCSAFWLEDRRDQEVPIPHLRIDELILRCEYFELKQEVF